MLLASAIFGIDIMLILIVLILIVCLAFVTLYVHDMLMRWLRSRTKPTAAALSLVLLFGSLGCLATVSLLRRILPDAFAYQVMLEVVVFGILAVLVYVFSFFLRVRHAERVEDEIDQAF